MCGPDRDEPATDNAARPTVDNPGPFTLRQLANLLVLRSRLREEHRSGLLGVNHYVMSVENIAARWVAGRESVLHSSPRAAELANGRLVPWACPHWLAPYLSMVVGLHGEQVEHLLNDQTADAESDPARAWRIDHVRAQVRLLEALHSRRLLRTLT